MVDASYTNSVCPGLELSGGVGTEKQEGRVSWVLMTGVVAGSWVESRARRTECFSLENSQKLILILCHLCFIQIVY